MTLPIGYVMLRDPPVVVADRDEQLVADGRTVAKRDYPRLYELLAHTYGGDDQCFCLPDFRDQTDQPDVGHQQPPCATDPPCRYTRLCAQDGLTCAAFRQYARDPAAQFRATARTYDMRPLHELGREDEL